MAWFRNSTTGTGQTWLWDGYDWQLKHTGFTGGHSTPFVYDPETGKLRRVFCQAHSMKWYDQFEWDGSKWSTIEQDCGNWKDYDVVTWDPTTGDLYGVSDGNLDCKSSIYRPLARWNGEKWIRIEDCYGPAGTSPTGTITYDEARSQIMISTDADQNNKGYVWDGCWENGGFFLQDPKRSGHAIGYDFSNQYVVLTGGTAPPYNCCKHTYYKGDEGQKNVYNTTITGNQLRMVYADHLGTLLGLRANDCWSESCKIYAQGWSADKWTYIWDGNVGFPTLDKKFSFSYDEAGQRLVAFGGGRFHYWTGEGEWWSPDADNPNPPGAAYDYSFMAHDVARNRSVVIGRVQGPSGHEWRQYDYDGSQWHWRDPLGPSGFESKIANGLQMVYARDRGTMFFVHPGGLSAWSGAKSRPHMVASFDLSGPEQVFPSPSDPMRRQVTSVETTVSAGGTSHTFGSGHSDGESMPGFRVYLPGHSPSGATLLGEQVGASPASHKSWTSTFAGDWTEYQDGYPTPSVSNWTTTDDRFELLVTTREAQGASPDPAHLSMDYAELRVLYYRGPIGEPGAECHDEEGYWKNGLICDDDDPATPYSFCRGGKCVGIVPGL